MSSIRSFIPLEKLGEGTYSSVYKVRRIDDGEVYALKKVKLTALTQKEKENALNEVRILASIESPYIVGYKQAFFDEALNVLCIVMEYADSGDVQHYIKSAEKGFKPIPEEEIWLAAEHILKALQTLHSKGILHRDLKCANVFRHSGVYKLGDLNVSKVNHQGNRLCYTQTGTPYYASPQVWRDEPYDLKSDLWSFGCVIYEMAALKPPFNGKDMEDLFKNVQKCKVPKWTSHYSPQLWQFVSLCLQKQPRNRPTAGQLIKWVNKHHSGNSAVKVTNKKQDNLLKTIKVPADLKKLNQALPESKYRKDFMEEKVRVQQKQPIKENNKVLMIEKPVFKKPNIMNNLSPSTYQYLPQSKKQQPQNREDCVEQKTQAQSQKHVHSKPSKNRSMVQLPSQIAYKKQQQTDGERRSPQAPVASILDNYSMKIHDGGGYPASSYKSPKNRDSYLNPSPRLFKSPKSELRLGKKVESMVGNYERMQQSDRKVPSSSKVERIRSSLINEVNDLLRKPSSIRRTEKNIINASHLVEGSAFKISEQDTNVKNKRPQEERMFDKNYSYIPSSGVNYRSGPQSGKVVGKYLIGQKSDGNDLIKRLVKKNRILSSGLGMKPSWGV